jgi:MraZ protein
MSLARLESFIGKATLAVDAAGRTNFPKEFRKVMPEAAGGQVVVTIGGTNTLALYPLDEWNHYVRKLSDAGTGADISKFRARITSMAKLSSLDGQNRITLTPEQMNYAGISGMVTFVGDGNRVRIWSPERFTSEVESVTAEEAERFEQWF